MQDIIQAPTDKVMFTPINTLEDSVKVSGYVKFEITDKDGNIVHQAGSNQVVYLGRHRMARALFGDAVTEKVINTLKAAGGAVAPGGDAMNPAAVSVNDAGLFETDPAKIYTKALSSPSFNPVSSTSQPTVSYTTSLTAAAVNMVINEIGMFFGATGPMFAHYSFSSLDLRNTTTNAYSVTWSFTF